MRPVLISLLAAVALLASAPVGTAARAETGIELVDGSGRAVLTLRGATLGELERGRLLITALPGRQPPDILVQGYDWQRVVNARTTIYGGTSIRFRVFRGSWRVRIQGTGINASAVGRGTVGLGGRGRYSLAGGAYLPWPAVYEVITLGS